MQTISRICCILLCAALLFTGCAAPVAPVTPEAPAAPAAPATPEAPAAAETPAADPDANKVWPDPAIAGNLPENPSIKDDFAAFVNHDWYANTEIPEGQSRWSAFSELKDNLKQQMIETLKTPDDSVDQQKLAALYASVTDTQTRDTSGNSTLMRSFYFVQDVKSLQELSDLFAGDGALYYFASLVRTGVSVDFKNSAVNIAQLGVPYLSLGDSAEYTTRTEQGDRFKAANDKFYKAILTHNGIEDAQADAMIADAFAFEEKLAAGIFPVSTQYRDDYYELIYNIYTPEELAALSPDFPLMAVLQNAGLGEVSRYMVSEPEAIKTLNALYTEENLPGLKAYLMIDLLTGLSSYGDTFSENATIEWSNEKYGSSGVKPVEERAYDMCNGLANELMGKVYAAKYFDEAAKADVTDMVNEVIGVFEARIQAADWLTEATRQTAVEKLRTMTLRIGYPTSYAVDWDAIGFEADQPLIENAMNAIILLTAQQNAKADQPVNKELWEMSANTINAYYNPSDNSINFPAAILQAPFYDKNASRSANLGAIGAVIAHEITHAFDTMGSQFDKDGNMQNWWTDEDRAAFKARTDKVAARYAAIEVINGEHVQGDLTIGETVADLGGVTCTLALVSELEDADYDAFFEAFTKIWAERITPELRVYYLKNDAHAPAYLRANVTIQQFQEFYDAYDIVEGDFMYTAPADRLVVW